MIVKTDNVIMFAIASSVDSKSAISKLLYPIGFPRDAAYHSSVWKKWIKEEWFHRFKWRENPETERRLDANYDRTENSGVK